MRLAGLATAGTVVEMKRVGKPSTSQQVGVSVALLLVDLMVIAWLLYGYGMTGWADSYDESNPPDAPQVARQSMCFLVGGAVVTGGGLLALGWRISGIVQLLLLGGGAGVFALFTAQ
ncbi:DUF6234 family protein [Streptomyces sp. NBC_01356]|uniref:DUF6234 family protein n=1 Tax=Streptomyces sp. NBC_01356 TaxID=2903836 RepID=UPI002E325792|nr:DUF6234 family protein [Streptomyces sp. NBC_01356]